MSTKRFTITLPDGSVARRGSQTRDYAYGVVARRDRHALAATHTARADALDRVSAEASAIIASGDLSTLKRAVTSVNGRGERFYSSYPPGAETDPYWQAEMARYSANGARYGRRLTDVMPTLPDWQNAESWAKYAELSMKHLSDTSEKLRADAATLASGERYAYSVVRWSETRQAAEKALGSAELGATDPTVSLSIRPVD